MHFLDVLPGVSIYDLELVKAPDAGMISPLRSDSYGHSDDLEVIEGLDSAVGQLKKRTATPPRKKTRVTFAIKENIMPSAPLDSEVEQQPSPQAKRTRRKPGKTVRYAPLV
jgi:hypothetical protein